jgi:hypothetical protein
VGASILATSCGETLPGSSGSVDAANASADGAADGAPDGAVDADAACATAAAPCNAEPVAFANPQAIAASADAMVWLEGDTVFALGAGAPVAVMKPLNSGSSTGFLTIQGVTVLTTQGSGVNRCNTNMPCISGGPAASMYALSNTGPIAADAVELFAAERGGQRRLARCELTMSCGDSPQVAAYLPDIATRVALTPSLVLVGLADKTLRAYLRSDRQEAGVASPPPLVTVGDLRGLAAAGDDIYWTDGASRTIFRCRAESCATSTEPVLDQRAFPQEIAIANGKAYWVETDADAVLRCTLPSCADSTTIIAKVAKPNRLAFGDRIYVSSETVQRIYAIAP